MNLNSQHDIPICEQEKGQSPKGLPHPKRPEDRSDRGGERSLDHSRAVVHHQGGADAQNGSHQRLAHDAGADADDEGGDRQGLAQGALGPAGDGVGHVVEGRVGAGVGIGGHQTGSESEEGELLGGIGGDALAVHLKLLQ